MVTSVQFSADGRRVVSGSMDGTLRVWEALTGQPIGDPILGHTAPGDQRGAKPDGKRVVSGSADHSLRMWDADTRRALGAFTGHTNTVTSVAFNGDGTRIVSGSYDNTVRPRSSKGEGI
jgi:hypothetical protein